MNTNTQLVNDFFHAAEAKDINTAIDFFTDNAEFIDPHYPNINMKGKEEIMEGLTWGFNGLKKLSFTVTTYFESEDGTSIAVEVATAHVLPTGKKLNFPQVFIFNLQDGKFSRIQAYEPYGPHGLVGVMLNLTRLVKKIHTSKV